MPNRASHRWWTLTALGCVALAAAGGALLFAQGDALGVNIVAIGVLGLVVSLLGIWISRNRGA